MFAKGKHKAVNCTCSNKCTAVCVEFVLINLKTGSQRDLLYENDLEVNLFAPNCEQIT